MKLVTKDELFEKMKKIIDLQFKLNDLNREYLHLLVDVTDETIQLKDK